MNLWPMAVHLGRLNSGGRVGYGARSYVGREVDTSFRIPKPRIPLSDSESDDDPNEGRKRRIAKRRNLGGSNVLVIISIDSETSSESYVSHGFNLDGF